MTDLKELAQRIARSKRATKRLEDNFFEKKNAIRQLTRQLRDARADLAVQELLWEAVKVQRVELGIKKKRS